jgi:hypothetical protein
MRGRVGALGIAWCLSLIGCVPGEDMQQIVSNPFGHGPEPLQTTSLYPPSVEQAMAQRVGWIGNQIVKANPELNLHPLFLSLGSEQTEIFHRGREIYITEGLVHKCVTDGQLAAVLSAELGKMVAERETVALPETRNPERRPPADVPVGNDSGGTFGPADGTHLVELARFERDRHPRDVTLPPPSPDLLTRRILQKTGYTLDDLDAARPLLNECEANGSWRKQFLQGIY